jgi:DNA invertase Pin-like site-specific DNA recombinase
MNKIKRVAVYTRVSTLLGQDVANQFVPIENLILDRSYKLYKHYSDEGISGLSESRPALNSLLYDLKRNQFDILITYSVDRLGRSTRHLLNFLAELDKYEVGLITIRESFDLTTPAGKFVFSVLGAVAQFEANLISERIKTALRVKKELAKKYQTSWRCGRPPLNDEIKKRVIELYLQKLSIRKISLTLGNISKTSVERILKNANVPKS